MRYLPYLFTLMLFVLGVLIGCSEYPGSPLTLNNQEDSELQDLLAKPFMTTGAIPPSPLETIEFGDASLTFWPYTGKDFSSQGHDPVNLVFVGEADPLDIRAALLALDGNRPGTPPMPPFTSRWTDAIGDVQMTYGDEDGWSGSAIQLACGDYAPLRFHLRLFKLGDQ